MSDSIWNVERDWGAVGGVTLSSVTLELPALSWARKLEPDLVALQRETGGRISAAGGVTQFIHESFNPGGAVMSRLAAEFNQLAGMKWVGGWQVRHGGRPVSMATWEEVDGERQDLVDVFCAFPSRSHFLEAYSELLHFDRYRPAHLYASQPLLWLHQIWAGGWATDSRYLGGLGRWMTAVWPIYADSVPVQTAPAYPQVWILTEGGRRLASAWLMDPDGPGPEPERTVVRARDLTEALGLQVITYNPSTRELVVGPPGAKKGA